MWLAFGARQLHTNPTRKNSSFLDSNEGGAHVRKRTDASLQTAGANEQTVDAEFAIAAETVRIGIYKDVIRHHLSAWYTRKRADNHIHVDLSTLKEESN